MSSAAMMQRVPPQRLAPSFTQRGTATPADGSLSDRILAAVKRALRNEWGLYGGDLKPGSWRAVRKGRRPLTTKHLEVIAKSTRRKAGNAIDAVIAILEEERGRERRRTLRRVQAHGRRVSDAGGLR